MDRMHGKIYLALEYCSEYIYTHFCFSISAVKSSEVKLT